MNKTRYFISNGLLLTLMLSTSVWAKNDKSVRALQDDLNVKTSTISKIGATIRSIEKELGTTNDDYIGKVDELKKVENQIIELKKELSSSAKNISNSYNQTKKILNHYLLEKIDDRGRDKLLKKKVYFKLLMGKMKKLKAAQKTSGELLITINEYDERLKSSKQNEETLYQLIVDLEQKKKVLGQDYISKMEEKNELEEQLENAIARSKVRRTKKKITKTVAHSNIDIDISLINPISSYISVKGSPKGVTYKYDKVAPVVSSQSGQVVYAGSLASYGKVVMIDHGKEIRSVILGDIAIKVKKGDIVSKGGVVAYTNVDPGLTKSLYYEVRKKNIAQNTLDILKKNNKNI